MAPETVYALRSFGTTRRQVGQGIEPLKGRPALIPPITTILRVPREPLEPLGRKKHEKRRWKSITASPVLGPFLEANRDKDTEALGHVTDCTTEEEVRQRVAFATRASQETPSEGEEGEEVRERVNER